VFLYKDVQGDLSGQLLGVFDLLSRLFSIESRTEVAIDYYDQHIFRGKTFADLQNNKGPFILINATDLNSQSQFIFTQYQFDFLCSDLSQFKIARAVAASSAVPFLFPPILIERYESCHYERPAWLIDAEKRSEQDDDVRLKEDVASLDFYLNKENPPYVTLVDGGVTDNLGLRTITKSVGLSGGANKIYERAYKNQKSPNQLVVVVVNASTHSDTEIGKSRALPSIRDTLSAVTDIQLHLYNTETNLLLKEQLGEWAQTISSKEHPIKSYFIELDVTGIQNPKDRVFFNQVPTSFSIDKEQADRLIDVARRLLRENPEFQRLLLELNDS
jgi:NTE family protein